MMLKKTKLLVFHCLLWIPAKVLMSLIPIYLPFQAVCMVSGVICAFYFIF